MISTSLTNYLAKFTQLKRNWNIMKTVSSHEILTDEALSAQHISPLHSLVNNISCHCSEKETKGCRVLSNCSSSQSKYVFIGHVGSKGLTM